MKDRTGGRPKTTHVVRLMAVVASVALMAVLSGLLYGCGPGDASGDESAQTQTDVQAAGLFPVTSRRRSNGLHRQVREADDPCSVR